jgi:hypothetical protein
MNRLLGTVSAIALAVGAAALLAPTPRRRRRGNTDHRDAVRIERVTRNALMYVAVPVWLVAGMADWICHRRTHIEHTSGARESLLHLLMLTELGIPGLAALFLEIEPPVFALMIAAFLAHEATALWDVSYAASRREISPIEQHVHSFLELVPLMAIGFLGCLHWPQLRALLHGKPGALAWKREPLQARYVATLLAAIIAFEWLPFAEELVRCLRAADGASKLVGDTALNAQTPVRP